MIILAIDPGTTQSGWVLLAYGRVQGAGVAPNAEVLLMIRESEADTLAIERFEARGMAISEDSVVTVLWTGRFQQAWHSPESVKMVKRSAVKSYLCGTQKAKDANVRQAVIDRIGPPGKKSAPGATYGVTSHAWQALGLAVTVCKIDANTG